MDFDFCFILNSFIIRIYNDQHKKIEYEFVLSPWIARGLLGLTILLAANEPSEFIYFAF